MTTELHEGPMGASPAPAAPAKTSWRQKRYERHRRRVWFEEILGWILVPLILFACYWAVDRSLNALGTSPAAILDGISTITAHF